MSSRSSRLLVVPLTLRFVVDFGLPLGQEMARGYALGLVDGPQLVRIAEHKLAAGVSLSGPEEELALLLVDEHHRVAELVAKLAVGSMSVEECDRYWIYLYLAYLLENAPDTKSALDDVALVWADFGHPDDIRDLVPFLPASNPATASPEMLMERWKAKVRGWGEHYSSRLDSAATADQGDPS